MKIKLWGTRGSIPTPSAGTFLTTRYGGDTTCFSIESSGHQIIIDAGTGLRLLGLEMMQMPPRHATFFFTHTHWDHIQGFPFFSPTFTQGFSFDLYGPIFPGHTATLQQILQGQQESEKFPIPFQNMPATLNFHTIQPEQTIILASDKSETLVTACPLNHPGGCLGYRIEEHRKGEKAPAILAIATDTEHFDTPNPQLQKLAAHADILLYDAQYTEEEYQLHKKGWGHSTWKHGLIEAQAAQARHLLLTHHDPLHDDTFVANMENLAQTAGSSARVKIQAAAQLQEFTI